MYTWRADDRGRIHVKENGIEWMPYPGPEVKARLEAIIARRSDMFREIGGRHGVHWAVLVAMDWRESNDNPGAVNQEDPKNPNDNGIGLFQITSRSLKGDHTDEQLKDPQLNTEIAAVYIARLQKTYAGDFVRVSCAFNAGSCRPDPSNKWNLHVTPGHIDAEVMALNYVLSRDEPLVEAPPIDLVAADEPPRELKESDQS